MELPTANNFFDLHSVSDVVMQMSYTAREGGYILRSLAGKAAQNRLPGNSLRLFAPKTDKPDDWFTFESSEPHLIPLNFSRNDFPYLPYKHEMFISRIEVFIDTEGCDLFDHIDVCFKEPHDCKDCDDIQVNCVRCEDWGGLYCGVLEKTFGPLGGVAQAYGSLIFPKSTEGIKQVYFLCTYEVERKNCLKTKGCGCGCGS